MSTHTVLWQVSLSNGETYQEGKAPFEEVPHELSPWQKLKEYLTKNSLAITSINLFTEDGKTFNLPSIGKNPNFAPFRNAPKPSSFNMFRALAQEANSDTPTEFQREEWYSVIEAGYEVGIRDGEAEGRISMKLQLWVDETNTKNCWSLITI